MLRYTIILLFIIAVGCSSTNQELTLAHDVGVPKEYRSGNFSKEHPGYFTGYNNCTIARYVDSYELGWLTAVQRHAKNIAYEDSSPFHMNGWEEEALGGVNGYNDACKRIRILIQVYGKKKVYELLNEWELPDEK